MIHFKKYMILFFLFLFCANGYGSDYEAAIIYAGVHPEKVEACMIWAFGKDFGSQSVVDIDDIWNEKHPDLFKAKGSDHPFDFYWKVGRLYMFIEILEGK